MPNSTSTWMVSGLRAAPIAAMAISKKSVLTGTSKMTLSIPRDRAGTFDPKLIAKYRRRFPDFDDKIISMFARGMSVREIRGHLRRALRHRRVGRPDLGGHRCGPGGGCGMAEPT